MQAVLSLDEGNYMALVFSGKAALELGKREEAKQFYKKAIAANAEEQLAWKVKIIVGIATPPTHVFMGASSLSVLVQAYGLGYSGYRDYDQISDYGILQ